jgi:cobalt-precorrin 5A hydrolase
MELGKAVIVAGIGTRKGVSAAEVVAAVEAALKEHGMEVGALAALATTEFKRGEEGIFEAGRMLGLEVMVVESAPSPPRSARHLSPVPGERMGAKLAAVHPVPSRSGEEVVSPRVLSPTSPRTGSVNRRGGEDGSLSSMIAGVESVSEAAALAAAGEDARLAGPHIVVGPVTCAIALGGGDQ